jgi:hypothetical protein
MSQRTYHRYTPEFKEQALGLLINPAKRKNIKLHTELSLS